MKTIKILLCFASIFIFNHVYALAYEVLHDCNNQGTGKITLTARYSEIAANAPFHFQWYNADGELLLEGFNKPNNVLNNLYAGTYTMTIADKDGCSGTHEIVVENINRTPCVDSIFSTTPKEQKFIREPQIPKNLFKKSTERGLLKVVPTLNKEKNRYYQTLLFINENGVDTIVHQIQAKILDVVFSNNMYHVLSLRDELNLYKYKLKHKKWAVFSTYNLHRRSPYSGINNSVKNAFFITETEHSIFVEKVVMRSNQAFIFKEINNVYQRIYGSGAGHPNFIKPSITLEDYYPCNYKPLRDSLLNSYKAIYYKAQKLINEYERDPYLFKNNFEEPSIRRYEIKKHVENLLLEEALNKEGFTYQQDDDLPKTFEISLSSTGIYIQQVNKKDVLKPIPTKKDSLIILRDPSPKVKIAKLPKEGNIRWTWLKDNLLSITFPDDTQKIYYIEDFNHFLLSDRSKVLFGVRVLEKLPK